MPNSSIGVTPGVGSNIGINAAGGLNYQLVKLDAGADGASYPIVGDSVHGLPVDVTRVQGVVIVNNPTPANLKVDGSGVTQPISAASALPVSAPVNAPLGVRLSDGTNPITTLPVSGTVTVAQGTPAATANPWPVEITDGTNVAGVSNVGGQKTLNVNVLQTVGVGAQPDKSAFTEGTTPIDVIGGEFNDSATTPSAGQVAAIRITQPRAMHVNLRNNAGTEIGTVGAPIRTDPVGTTTQPVNVGQIAGATAATVAAGVQKVALGDSGGASITAANPLPALAAPTPSGFWKNGAAYTASQTDIALRTPAGGKAFYVEGYIITVTTSGTLKIYDQTNAAANMIYQGSPPAGACIVVTPTRPIPSSAVNNILRYTSGAGATGDVSVWGYDA